LSASFGRKEEKIGSPLQAIRSKQGKNSALNEIYESEWVHLIWKKNGRCFGYIRRPYGQGEK
jgi:hypothetical protein